MKRSEVKTGMFMFNGFSNHKGGLWKLLYIVEANSKYIECIRIDSSGFGTFRIGKDWDRSMENYRPIYQDMWFALLFKDLIS